LRNRGIKKYKGLMWFGCVAGLGDEECIYHTEFWLGKMLENTLKTETVMGGNMKMDSREEGYESRVWMEMDVRAGIGISVVERKDSATTVLARF
jgi:hypothetical protein